MKDVSADLSVPRIRRAPSGRCHLRLVVPPPPAMPRRLVDGARRALRVAKSAAGSFIDDHVPRLGAALSYYAVFSLAPLLILVLTVVSLVFDAGQSRQAMLAEIGGVAGADAATAVATMLEKTDWQRDGLLATVIALVIVLVGASAVTSELKESLDHIFGLPARRRERPMWYSLVAVRLQSLSMVLAIGLLLLASLVISAVLTAFGTWWTGKLAAWAWVLEGVNAVVSTAIVTALYYFVYRFFPERRLPSRACLAGAVTAAVLFAIGKHLIGRYIGAAGVGSTFGAAGSLAIIMIWVYWTSQIVLFGAEVARTIEADGLSSGSAGQAGPAVAERSAGRSAPSGSTGGLRR